MFLFVQMFKYQCFQEFCCVKIIDFISFEQKTFVWKGYCLRLNFEVKLFLSLAALPPPQVAPRTHYYPPHAQRTTNFFPPTQVILKL